MFYELAKERYSVRHYSQQPVEDFKINIILEVGRISPTAANKQPHKIYVLKSLEAMDKARETTRMIYDAPIALLICYDKTLSWKANAFGEEYDGGEVDAAIVTTSMMMQATELGVGTLWVRGFDSRKVSEVFELPENIHPVCYLLLGYPSDDSSPKSSHNSRKELYEIVTYL